jgi:hypothetical protein
MPDALDLIQQDQSRALDQRLGQAYGDSQWSNYFKSTPPSDVLRANRDLGDLVNTAIERRQQLAAQGSIEGQRMLYNAQKQQEWEDQAPMRDQLLRGRIEHEAASTAAEGSATALRQKLETDSLNDTAGFADYMSTVKADEGTPEYKAAVFQGIKQFPGAAHTPLGADMLKTISDRHDTAADVLKAPDGMEAATFETDSTGKSRATFKPKTPEFETEDQAREQFGADATIHQTATGKWTATIKPDADPNKVSEATFKAYADAKADYEQHSGVAGDPDIADPTTKATAKHQAAAAKTLMTELEGHYPGLKPKTDDAPAAKTSDPKSAYVPGEQYGTQIFKGGDPTKPENWQPAP